VATVAVLGEALIDLVEAGDDEPRLARPGGSPYNVAIGLARLGHTARFVGRFSADPLGELLRRHALRSGVDLSLALTVPEPSTIALVELDAHGGAQYRFGVDGTADFGWTAAELSRLPLDTPAFHFGSLTSWLPPGAAPVAARVAELRAAGAFVSYDPNVRPLLQPDPAAARAQVEDAVPLAHLVKTSAEDLAYLYPETNPGEIAGRWLQLGARLVVVTDGGAGATAFTADAAVSRPAPHVDVVDTVGAGDAFTSGLLDALGRRGLLHPDGLSAAPLAEVLDEAALVAAVTCSRAGANPPRASELGR
jgi:fructokinase